MLLLLARPGLVLPRWHGKDLHWLDERGSGRVVDASGGEQRVGANRVFLLLLLRLWLWVKLSSRVPETCGVEELRPRYWVGGSEVESEEEQLY